MLPKNRPPTHPGEMLLKEFLEPLGITQTDFSRHLGWPYARLNEIIKGKRGKEKEEIARGSKKEGRALIVKAGAKRMLIK